MLGLIDVVMISNLLIMVIVDVADRDPLLSAMAIAASDRILGAGDKPAH